MSNSYGFNGIIPDDATYGVYSFANGCWVGIFYNSEESAQAAMDDPDNGYDANGFDAYENGIAVVEEGVWPEFLTPNVCTTYTWALTLARQAKENPDKAQYFDDVLTFSTITGIIYSRSKRGYVLLQPGEELDPDDEEDADLDGLEEAAHALAAAWEAEAAKVEKKQSGEGATLPPSANERKPPMSDKQISVRQAQRTDHENAYTVTITEWGETRSHTVWTGPKGRGLWVDGQQVEGNLQFSAGRNPREAIRRYFSN